jgi:acyl-CoA reductase-like NAD-dependent aldehyde dehydrogenase
VDERVAAPFLERLVEQARAIRMGDPRDPMTDMGPMTTEEQRDIVRAHVVDALDRGATLLTGGRIPDRPGRFYEPTVLAGVDHSMRIMQEESFGPVVPVMIIDSVEEAVEMANDCAYGLAASVWTQDPARADWVAQRLESGMVAVNEHAVGYVEATACFGGEGISGIGRTHGTEGIRRFTRTKHVSSEYRRAPAAWWFPYNHELREFLTTAITAVFRPGLGGKIGRFGRLMGMRRFRRSARLFALLKRWRRLF